MNEYGITTWDILNDAIGRFNQKYGIYSDGSIGYNPAYRQQLEQQRLRQEFENVMNELNQRVEHEREMVVREHFHNVMNDIEAKREAVRDILKPIPQVQNDIAKEQEYIKILQDHAKLEKGVEIEFRNNKNITKRVRFSELKQPIIDFLDSIQDYTKWFFQFSIKVGNKDKWTTVPLNDEGIRRVHDMLTQDLFDQTFKNTFNNRIDDDKSVENRIIECSDSNVSRYGIQDFTMDMISKITITDKPHLGKAAETKIYCDVSGGFYDRRLIEECTSELEAICKRYQIFKGVLDPETNKPRKEYEMNCLMYAFTMSGQFDEKTLASMKARCFTRIVSKKQLKDLCELYNIHVNLIKYSEIEQRWQKAIKINNVTDAKYHINLALIRKHYFLDETIHGLTSFYLNHYNEINQYCIEKKKPISWGMIVAGKSGKRYRIDSRIGSIESTAFILLLDKLFTQPLTFSDKGIMQTDLYHFVTTEITELGICKEDTKLIKYEQKEHTDKIVYYADCEADVVSNVNHEAYCVSYIKRGDSEPHCIFGEDCISKFYDLVEDKAVVYFHNLGYDGRLMNEFYI